MAIVEPIAYSYEVLVEAPLSLNLGASEAHVDFASFWANREITLRNPLEADTAHDLAVRADSPLDVLLATTRAHRVNHRGSPWP